MPQYKVLQRSFIGDRLVEEGEIVEYSGEASKENLALIKTSKKAATATTEESTAVTDTSATDTSAGAGDIPA